MKHPTSTSDDKARQADLDGHPTDISQSLLFGLLRAREAIMGRMRPIQRAHGVTEPQWRVLRTLAAKPGIEATELARSTLLLQPSLTRILRDLRDAGLIERRSEGASPRRSGIFISKAGLELVAGAYPELNAVMDEIEQRYGREAMKALTRDLFELTRSLS